jgi:starch synthase (maltosyl-transferring)
MATFHADTSRAQSAERRPTPIQDGRLRVVIEKVTPQIDCGRFAIKRTIGDMVRVDADVFADGYDAVAAMLLHRTKGASEWTRLPMRALGYDRWSAEFKVDRAGDHFYQIAGWVDYFASWKRNLQKRIDARQDIAADLLIGAELIRQVAASAAGPDMEQLELAEDRLRNGADERVASSILSDYELDRAIFRWSAASAAVSYSPEFHVTVDRPRAAFSAWYEMFPRSAATNGRHGTLLDVEARLPYVASMGFDVLYLPPIHPIGRAFRKGRNNAEVAHAEDVGSPWGIGSEEGGHKSIHPQLGTMADFRRLIAAAERHGIELALDVAFQASPEHPYVREHPEWFRKRPDGTIQYAENPPKKYQDIYPFDFETEAWQALWQELKSVFDFWIDEGVRIFRVDNPHTKPFGFWEWVIREIRSEHPDVLFWPRPSRGRK